MLIKQFSALDHNFEIVLLSFWRFSISHVPIFRSVSLNHNKNKLLALHVCYYNSEIFEVNFWKKSQRSLLALQKNGLRCRKLHSGRSKDVRQQSFIIELQTRIITNWYPEFFKKIMSDQNVFFYRLCCQCGVAISPNPANMCVGCIRTQVDITADIPKQVVIYFCRFCER